MLPGIPSLSLPSLSPKKARACSSHLSPSHWKTHDHKSWGPTGTLPSMLGWEQAKGRT